MTKGALILSLAIGGILGLFVPRLFGVSGIGIANIITAIIGAIAGLIVLAIYVHWYGRVR